MEKIKAIITGTTGMVGEGVLHECLNHPLVQQVLVVNRKSCGVVHEKLKEIIHSDFYDFNSIGPFKQKIAGLKTYLEKMSKCPSLMNDSDLLNIRDELLANLNKFTYLLTFK